MANLMSTWIHGADVARLDTSTTGSNRNLLLDRFAAPCVTVNNVLTIGCTKWMWLRNLKPAVWSSKLGDGGGRCLSKVKKLKLVDTYRDISNPIHAQLIQKCSNLTSLHYVGCHVDKLFAVQRPELIVALSIAYTQLLNRSSGYEIMHKIMKTFVNCAYIGFTDVDIIESNTPLPMDYFRCNTATLLREFGYSSIMVRFSRNLSSVSILCTICQTLRTDACLRLLSNICQNKRLKTIEIKVMATTEHNYNFTLAMGHLMEEIHYNHMPIVVKSILPSIKTAICKINRD